MKTGEVQDPGGGGAEPHLEVDGWTSWLYDDESSQK
jgi:hypothetical protein